MSTIGGCVAGLVGVWRRARSAIAQTYLRSLRHQLEVSATAAPTNRIVDDGAPITEGSADGRDSTRDWSPELVLEAARSRWISPSEIVNAGPPEERADRIAAYKRGRVTLIKTLLGRDGGRLCIWCAGTLNGQLTVEHIIPRFAGGSHEPVNLCLACRPCNMRRGASDAIAWYLQCRDDGMRPRARVLARRLQTLGVIADLSALRSLEAEHARRGRAEQHDDALTREPRQGSSPDPARSRSG